MSKLTLNLSGMGGLAPHFWGSHHSDTLSMEDKIIGSEDQLAGGIWNPFRLLGYLTPSNNTFTACTYGDGISLAALPTSCVIDSLNGAWYAAEEGQKLLYMENLQGTTFAVALDLGSTGTPKILDLEIYQVNSVRKLFVIYETGDKTEIAISNLPYDTDTDNLIWLSNTVTGSAGAETLSNRAFMRVADNGFAYLFRDNRIDKIDGTTTGGTNGTITNNIILFPSIFNILDAVDMRGKFYIALQQARVDIRNGVGVYRPNVCGVYIWDRQTASFNMSDYIPIEGVNAILRVFISHKGTLRAITTSSLEGMTQLREFNGSEFVVIKEVGGVGAHPTHIDGVATTAFGTYWICEDGTISFYGNVLPEQEEGLFKVADMNVASHDPLGGFLVQLGAASPMLYVSRVIAGTPDTYGIFQHYLMTGGSATNVGNIYTLTKYLPQMSNVNYVDIYMRPSTGTGSTTAGTVKIYFNQSSTAWASKVITQAETALGYKRIEINKPFVNAIQLEIEYPTTAISDKEFNPSMAVVDYTPTTTKG